MSFGRSVFAPSASIELASWWAHLAAKWSWDDPTLLLGVVTIAVTALIPIFLWRLGSRQAEHDALLNKSQAATLERQEGILRRQRRDSLLEIVGRSSDAAHISLLWREVGEYGGGDRELLLSVFRTNPSLALPGTSFGVRVEDRLDGVIVEQYINGLERRYSEDASGYRPFPGLLDFLVAAREQGTRVDASRITSLVTGQASEHQRPGHSFFRAMVGVFPESASGLLRAVEGIDSRSAGGLRLNVLTGTLLAVKDADLGRLQLPSVPRDRAVAELRGSLPVALASLIHRDNLRTFDQWSLNGSTEPITATVAWLIRAVGWLADTDDHLAMRMTQNLADAIRSASRAGDVPGWGIDDRDVRVGFDRIKRSQPCLWDEYGPELESAASAVGAWREGPMTPGLPAQSPPDPQGHI